MITLQPASAMVTAGSGVSFRVAAEGAATLVYQWQKGGANLADNEMLSGATTTALTLNDVSQADEGMIVLTYSPSNSTLYIDGQAVVTSGLGTTYWPRRSIRADGFTIGSNRDGLEQARGQFDELETLNYVLSPATVASLYNNGICQGSVQWPGALLNSTNLCFELDSIRPAHVDVLTNDTNYLTATFSESSVMSTNVCLSLPGDGIYQVAFGFSIDGATNWRRMEIVIDTTAPVIAPASQSYSVTLPLLQIVGTSSEPVSSISYDLVNAQTTNLDQQGFVLRQEIDPVTAHPRTNHFQCFDLSLAEGENTVTVRATDLAGNVATVVYTYTFSRTGSTAPVLRIDWPSNLDTLCGSNFTVLGWVSDPSAVVVAQTSSDGCTNTTVGSVGRSGDFRIDGIRSTGPTNCIVITATDASGNSSTTNITVMPSLVEIHVDPIDPTEVTDKAHYSEIWWLYGTINSNEYDVLVNGEETWCYWSEDGVYYWDAWDVPIGINGRENLDVRAVAK